MGSASALESQQQKGAIPFRQRTTRTSITTSPTNSTSKSPASKPISHFRNNNDRPTIMMKRKKNLKIRFLPCYVSFVLGIVVAVQNLAEIRELTNTTMDDWEPQAPPSTNVTDPMQLPVPVRIPLPSATAAAAAASVIETTTATLAKAKTDTETKTPRPNEDPMPVTKSLSSTTLLPQATIATETKTKTNEATSTTKAKRVNKISNKDEAGTCVDRWTDRFAKKPRNDDDPDRQERKRKPILYIHPGPPKTATTTIQTLLQEHSHKLREDNIFYIGKILGQKRPSYRCDFPLPSSCIAFGQHQKDNIRDANCVDILKEELDGYYRAGADVVYSEEILGAQFAMQAHNGAVGSKMATTARRYKNALATFMNEIVRSNDWDVRIWIGYRPYFDYRRSLYNQQHKLRGASNLSLLNWPGQKRGKHIPLLRDYLANKDDSKDPTPGDLMDRFQGYADTMQVFDIAPRVHNGTDLTVHLFCNLLEGATSACAAQTRAVASRGGEGIRSNTAVELDHDRIATAAAELGLLEIEKHRREAVSENVRKHMDLQGTKLSDLPQLCPSEDLLAKLYERSLQEEMKLFPDRNPDWMVPGVFNETVATKQLCSVDTEKLLQDPEWQSFFRSLEPTKNKTQTAERDQEIALDDDDGNASLIEIN